MRKLLIASMCCGVLACGPAMDEASQSLGAPEGQGSDDPCPGVSDPCDPGTKHEGWFEGCEGGYGQGPITVSCGGDCRWHSDSPDCAAIESEPDHMCRGTYTCDASDGCTDAEGICWDLCASDPAPGDRCGADEEGIRCERLSKGCPGGGGQGLYSLWCDDGVWLSNERECY